MESLEILNGELSPKYDKYNNIYTVSISNDVNVLDLKYNINENENINVYGNLDLKEGENKVIIAYTDASGEVDYITLIVNKERTSTVLNDLTLDSNLEVMGNTIPFYTPYLIGASCFMIIILLYILIFKKRKI